MAAALHARTPALRDLFDLRSPAARDALNGWYERGGRRLVPAPTAPPSGAEPVPPARGGRIEVRLG